MLHSQVMGVGSIFPWKEAGIEPGEMYPHLVHDIDKCFDIWHVYIFKYHFIVNMIIPVDIELIPAYDGQSKMIENKGCLHELCH